MIKKNFPIFILVILAWSTGCAAMAMKDEALASYKRAPGSPGYREPIKDVPDEPKKEPKKDLRPEVPKKPLPPLPTQKDAGVKPAPVGDKSIQQVPKKEQSVLDKLKEKVEAIGQKIETKLIGQPKTPAEAAKLEELKKLFDAEFTQKSSPVDPYDRSPLEKVAGKIGWIVACKTPGAKRLMETSIGIHRKIDNSQLGRFSKKMNDNAAAFKSSVYRKFMDKSLVKDSEVNAALKAPETTQQFEKELQEKVQSKLQEEDRAKIVKKLTDEEAAKGTKIDDVVKARIQADAEKQVAKTYSDDDKKRVELAIKGDFEKSFEENFKRGFANSKLEKEADEKLKTMAKEDPEKYQKELIKIGKAMGMKSSEVKALLENPQKQEDVKRVEVLREKMMEEVKSDLKKTWIAKFQDLGSDARNFSQKPTVIGMALVGSTIFGLIVGQVQNLIEKKGMAENISENFKQEALQNVLDSEAKEKFKMQQPAPGQDDSSLTGEQVMLNGIKSVFNFYSQFDEIFIKVLKVYGYNDKYFNVLSKLTFPGGSVSAGAAILFGYPGAGNIATGFTPVPIKVFPIQIMGQAFSVESIITSIVNEAAVDLVVDLIAGSPETVFCIKVISLLNTANKTISNPEKRVEFLNNEMNLLYARFVKTVSDKETARSNALEPDDDKWEPVYFKYPVQCLQSVSKVIRNMIKDMYVDGVKDENGNPGRVSFEQYLVDRFEVFDEMNKVEFEGDLKYEESSEQLNDGAVESTLFAIFLRAFNEILMLESDLMKKDESVEIKGILGKIQQIVGKVYFQQVTQNAFDKLQAVQAEFIGVMVDSANDFENPDMQKAYQSAEVKYKAAFDAYMQATLKYRRTMCFYSYERTLGIEPERVFDFITRECQRTYRKAINKTNYDAILTKIFKLYAPNFSFTVKDLLGYAKSEEAIKPTVRMVEGQ